MNIQEAVTSCCFYFFLHYWGYVFKWSKLTYLEK